MATRGGTNNGDGAHERPIYPSEVDPEDYVQVTQMIRSWQGRGIPAKDVPLEVRFCKSLVQALHEAVRLWEGAVGELEAIEKFMDREAEALASWRQSATQVAVKEALHGILKDAEAHIGYEMQREREETLAKVNDGRAHVRTRSPRETDGTATPTGTQQDGRAPRPES